MSNIKLITLNVEHNKHWARIIPFLREEKPDVLCMQELFKRDLEMLKRDIGYHVAYLPCTRVSYDPDDSATLELHGNAILSRFPFSDVASAYYHQVSKDTPRYCGDSAETKRETQNFGVIWATIKKEGAPYTIATTHFTWTPDGRPGKYQKQDARALIKILKDIPDVVFCGDLNIPRKQNKIYYQFANEFKDNIPEGITSTLDINIHRARKDPKLATFVVDYIFSTPEYAVSNVRKKCGISDHCAIIADVSCRK